MLRPEAVALYVTLDLRSSPAAHCAGSRRSGGGLRWVVMTRVSRKTGGSWMPSTNPQGVMSGCRWPGGGCHCGRPRPGEPTPRNWPAPGAAPLPAPAPPGNAERGPGLASSRRPGCGLVAVDGPGMEGTSCLGPARPDACGLKNLLICMVLWQGVTSTPECWRGHRPRPGRMRNLTPKCESSSWGCRPGPPDACWRREPHAGKTTAQ